jgi:ATP-binding protein involved in chromosome partitioning
MQKSKAVPGDRISPGARALSELETRVYEALKQVRFPGMSRDIVSFGFVAGLDVAADGGVTVDLRLSTHRPEAAEEVRRAVEQRVGALEGVSTVRVALDLVPPQHPAAGAQRAVMQSRELLPEVRHVVAVASGKGGVGKSTVAANLAVALGQLGHRAGLVDADIYGPSVPMMFGIDERPRVTENRILPFEKYGIELMSLGFVLDTDTPVIWRGPMVMKAIEQLLGDVVWGPLDFLVVDLPPGTGDAQLTIGQKVPLSGAVIVTTPQDVALIDARKGLAMFRRLNVPVLGIVENMSVFVCPHCGGATEIFKRGGGHRTAELLEVPFLGSIPLDPRIVEGGDAGVPIVVAEEEGGPHRTAFQDLARAVAQEADKATAGRQKLTIV